MKKSTEELDAITIRLERFVRFLTPDGPMVRGSIPPKAKRIANGLLRVRDLARNLHSAINHGWRSGCHSEHNANLVLDDQLDAGLVTSRYAFAKETNPYLEFRLALVPNASEALTDGYETSVLVLSKDNDQCGPNESGAGPCNLVSAFARVTITTPDDTRPQHQINMVENICDAIAVATTCETPISLVLTSGPRLGSVASARRTLMPHHYSDRIVLTELLQSTDRPGHQIPLSTCSILALKLASNLLQLSQTPWLRGAWSSDMVFFPLRPGSDQDLHSRIDFGRPFISSTFKESHPTIPSSSDVTPKEAFLELGIVLLEIWHQKTIDAHFPVEAIPIDFNGRMALASRWRTETLNPPLELYDQAVRYCIFGVISSPTPTPQWDDKQLWSVFCGEVIEPLHQSCKSWRGS
jgi:hypothetical protein